MEKHAQFEKNKDVCFLLYVVLNYEWTQVTKIYIYEMVSEGYTQIQIIVTESICGVLK